MNGNTQRQRDEAPAYPGAPTVSWGGPGAIILVPLDGSIESKAALPVARLISTITGASVHTLHVGHEQLSQKDLLRCLKLSRREETIGLVFDQVSGDPAEAIVRRAAQKKVMVIAMTTRGPITREGEPLGPVSEHVLYEASCPVLFVRPENAPYVAQIRALHRILLPLDGAPSTMAVIGPAVSLAEKSGASLDVLYVAGLHAVAAEEPGTLTTPRYVDQPQYEWPAWVRECLDRFCAVVGECPSAAPTKIHVRPGEPRLEILDFATEEKSDLIVLEWRGRFDPTHGDVVKSVLQEASCPVLLLRTVPA